MASVLQNDQHIRSSDFLKRTNTLRQFRRTKPDLIRLATFRPWRTNTQCNVSPALLSKVGFSYTGKGDCVKCDACNLQIDSWKPGMDPVHEHMERSPQCPFVLKQSELFARKGTLSSRASASPSEAHPIRLRREERWLNLLIYPPLQLRLCFSRLFVQIKLCL